MANKKYKLSGYYRKAGETEWSKLEVVVPLTPEDIEDLQHPEFWNRSSSVRDMLFELIDFDPKASVKGGSVDIDDFAVVEAKQ